VRSAQCGRRAALLIALFAALATAGEPVVAPLAITGYSFVPGKAVACTYDVKQEVEWSSAGDRLAYTSTLLWTFILRARDTAADAVAVPGGAVVVDCTYVRVRATHQGPGSNRLVDSRPGVGDDRAQGDSDALLGHLLVFPGITLGLTVDPATGVVSAVSGGDELIARINRRFPAAGDPGAVPPLDAAARVRYSGPALAAWWSQVLALPSPTPQVVPLTAPLSGALERRWTGNRYTLGLPAGAKAIPAQLAVDAAAVVQAELIDASGAGGLRLDAGMPAEADGTLAFTLRLVAATQGVEQKHRLTWKMRRVTAE